MSEIEIEIDGKKLQAKADAMVIQVADEAGVYIPRFCYHKHLSVAANCRMCLVEVEKAPKPLPACATPVMPGMKVFTRSPKALAAQKAVMEFLLINHPLDCPICDQGGECELQDLSMGYGAPNSFYHEGKRVVKDKDIGPLIATEMTRCIQCTRCVRFGDEVAGFRELGATGRGENMEIGTYITHALQSEVSGNIIDLCPVGALTSKPFRFTARAWELIQFASIAAHDCVGSNINVHTRNGRVMRVVPREKSELNQTWISDRDRFSYEGLYHSDRLSKPLIRVDGRLQETDWHTALEVAATELQRVVAQGADELAALASPNATVEEFYLLQKILRCLGSENIDHRLRQSDFSDQAESAAFPGLSLPLSELEKCDTVFLIGSNVQHEQPMVSLRVRKAALKGAQVLALNMLDYGFHFNVALKEIVAPHQFVMTLAKVAKALCPEHGDLKDVVVDEAAVALAEKLRAGKKVSLLLGALALNHLEAATIRALAALIAERTQANLGYLTEGANAVGAWLAGMLPHRAPAGVATDKTGLNAKSMWQQTRKAYVLLNVEPDVDCADSVAASTALEQAECVVALAMFRNPVIEQFAKVILPITPFTETSGTFVNMAGEWQSFKGVATAWGEARPAWKVLRVLGNMLDCEGFMYESSDEVREEVKKLVDAMNFAYAKPITKIHLQKAPENVLTRVGDVPIYAGDAIVRRAPSLQSTQTIIEGNSMIVRIHPKTAHKLQVKETEPVMVKQKNNALRLPVVFDERVPEQAARVVSGVSAMSELNELFGEIEITKL